MIALVAPLMALCAPVQPPAPAAPPAVALGRPYDAQNPFAKILRGELPVAKVYQDAHVLAFMDHAPVSPGHVLVISRTSHARNLIEMKDRDLDRLIDVARRIGEAQMAGLGADGFTLQQNNVYGQSVPHLHIHVIPLYAGHARCPGSGLIQPVSALEPVAARIRAALAAQHR